MGFRDWLKQLLGPEKEKPPITAEQEADARTKWAELKEKVLKDLATEVERQKIIVPKDRTDDNQWKVFYQECVARLENAAVSLPARMVWVTHAPKNEKLVEEYLATIDRILKGEKVEERAHKLESAMASIILEDARRIREKYAKFF